MVCELYLKSKCEHEIKIRKRPSYEEPRNNVPKWAYVSAGGPHMGTGHTEVCCQDCRIFFVSQKLKLSLFSLLPFLFAMK